jgi:hypothetical protein
MNAAAEKCRVNSSVVREMENLFVEVGPEDIACQCDRQMGLLMCLAKGESEGDDYYFLAKLRDTFNRIAVILGREPFKPGIEPAAAGVK